MCYSCVASVASVAECIMKTMHNLLANHNDNLDCKSPGKTILFSNELLQLMRVANVWISNANLLDRNDFKQCILISPAG